MWEIKPTTTDKSKSRSPLENHKINTHSTSRAGCRVQFCLVIHSCLSFQDLLHRHLLIGCSITVVISITVLIPLPLLLNSCEVQKTRLFINQVYSPRISTISFTHSNKQSSRQVTKKVHIRRLTYFINAVNVKKKCKPLNKLITPITCFSSICNLEMTWFYSKAALATLGHTINVMWLHAEFIPSGRIIKHIWPQYHHALIIQILSPSQNRTKMTTTKSE